MLLTLDIGNKKYTRHFTDTLKTRIKLIPSQAYFEQHVVNTSFNTMRSMVLRCSKDLVKCVNKCVHFKLFFGVQIHLTHCGLVTPYGDKGLGQNWLR